MGIITLGLVIRNKKTEYVGTVIAVLYELNKPIQLTVKQGREEEWVEGRKTKPTYVFANASSDWEMIDMPLSTRRPKRRTR